MTSCDVLCGLSITYIYKDDIGIGPAWISFISTIPRFGWTLRPILSMLSDNYPIFGSRRKSYIIIGCVINFFSAILIGIISKPTLWLTSIVLTFWNLGSAMCSVAGEALVVEGGRHNDNLKAASHVSVYFALKRISVSLMAYGSSVLLLYIKPKNIFWIASSMPLITFILVLFISEPKVFNRVPQSSLNEQYNNIKAVLLTSHVYNPILFLFLRTLTPSASSAMFYFMTEKLHFHSEIFGRANLLQCIASLIAIYSFNKYCQDFNLRHLLTWSTIIATPFCLSSIIVIKRWNLLIGIPDTAFVITDSIILEFVNEFQCIPIIILTSRLCPRGLESTINSIIMTILNHGVWTGSIISAIITDFSGVTSTNFDNLHWLVVISSTTHMLPLLMINLMPTKLPSSEQVDRVITRVGVDDVYGGECDVEDSISLHDSQDSS